VRDKEGERRLGAALLFSPTWKTCRSGDALDKANRSLRVLVGRDDPCSSVPLTRHAAVERLLDVSRSHRRARTCWPPRFDFDALSSTAWKDEVEKKEELSVKNTVTPSRGGSSESSDFLRRSRLHGDDTPNVNTSISPSVFISSPT